MIKLFKPKKIKVVFRTTSGEKICTVKFDKIQFALIEMSLFYSGKTLDQFFTDLMKDIVADVQKNYQE